MKPSSKSVSRFGATAGCISIFGLVAVLGTEGAAARSLGPMIHMAPMQSGAVAPHQAGRNSRNVGANTRRPEFGRFRRGQSFGWGYGYWPLLSGSFETAPLDWGEAADEGAPPGWGEEAGESAPPGYILVPVPVGAPPPRCIRPLVIEIERRKPARKPPRVVYGGASFCPPPMIATPENGSP